MKFLYTFIIVFSCGVANIAGAATFVTGQCAPDRMLTQNLRSGGYDGLFDHYTGSVVREAHILQYHLNRLGFSAGKVDGKLGPVSTAAIKRMQVFLGTRPDGYVGPITRRLLNMSCGSMTEEQQHILQVSCMYNHAYQENYDADSIDDIIGTARDCYVLLDTDDVTTEQLDEIQQHNTVGCYMSVGTAENWRDDFGILKPYVADKAWSEWDDEYFIARISPDVVRVMKQRIKKRFDAGCDWIEFDNMDWVSEENQQAYNLDITIQESHEFIVGLCEYAHSLGLKCMAKNTTYENNIFDGLTVESYTDNKNWWNQSELKTIMNDQKLGIIVHYNEFRCDNVYRNYVHEYGNALVYICEDKKQKKYLHNYTQ